MHFVMQFRLPSAAMQQSAPASARLPIREKVDPYTASYLLSAADFPTGNRQ